MTFLDPRQTRDPHRIASFPANTSIRWDRDYRQHLAHGYLMPGDEHLLLTVHRDRSGAWQVKTGDSAIINVGYAEEQLAVPGRFRSAEDAMRAAERELYEVLQRLAAAAWKACR